jgi:hypothetical protein
VLEQAIDDVQLIEQSISGNKLSDLRIRLALRSCLTELRGLVNGREIPAIRDLSGSTPSPRH